MVTPTIFARQSLSYFMADMQVEALNVAVQAQGISPIWHIVSYLQAVALFALRRDNEGQIALGEGTILEEKQLMFHYIVLVVVCSTRLLVLINAI